MFSIKKGLKNFIYKVDFFHTAQLLRYKEEPEYRTLLGGTLSLTIIIILIATFYNKIISTINKIVINTSVKYQNNADPLSYNISSMGGKFMFGAEIWHYNLNNITRYFDVSLVNIQYNIGQNNQTNSIQYPLQPCTLDHWQPYPQILQLYDRLSMDTWLCLPLNKQFQIKGKYSSLVSKTLSVSVSKCTNSSRYPNPCASNEEIQAFLEQEQNLYFTIYFINPLINAASNQYLSYYLEDNNYLIFTPTLGSQGTLFMEEFSIQTDQSILPLSDVRKQSGGIVRQMAMKNSYQVTDDNPKYCTYQFFKSGIQTDYERSYQKIDETLAYIGGLFSTISGILFIISVYNQYSYELSIGSSLFKSQKQYISQNIKKYNFFNFLSHMFYAGIQIIGFSPKWQKIKEYYNRREEMLKQLDIHYLLERILYLQTAIEIIFDEHQLQGIYFQDKMLMKDASKKRKKFKEKKIYLKKIIEKNKSQKLKLNNTSQQLINIFFDKDKLNRNLTNQCLQHKETAAKSDDHDRSNKKWPTQIQNVDKIQQIPYISSDSESEQQDEVQTSKNYCSQYLLKLKEQSKSKNNLSSRIWNRLHPLISNQVMNMSAMHFNNDQFQIIQNDFQKKDQSEPYKKNVSTLIKNSFDKDIIYEQIQYNHKNDDNIFNKKKDQQNQMIDFNKFQTLNLSNIIISGKQNQNDKISNSVRLNKRKSSSDNQQYQQNRKNLFKSNPKELIFKNLLINQKFEI